MRGRGATGMRDRLRICLRLEGERLDSELAGWTCLELSSCLSGRIFVGGRSWLLRGRIPAVRNSPTPSPWLCQVVQVVVPVARRGGC